MNQLLLGILGFSGGIIVAGGAIALIVGLGIVPRYAGITHTGHRIRLYETCILWGSILGNIGFIYHPIVPFGLVFLPIFGLFSGIFLGGWILALAEVVNVFPIFSRRFQFKKGVVFVILSIAVGKFLGAIYHFLMLQKIG